MLWSAVRRRGEFLCNFLDADLGELINGAEDVGRLLEQVQLLKQSIEDLAIVHTNREFLHAERAEELVNDEDHLDVGGVADGANCVEVALDELAVTAALRVLAAPNWSDMIALKRQRQFVLVLRDNRASGIVRSNRMPTSRPPLSLKRYICLSVSALPFAQQNL